MPAICGKIMVKYHFCGKTVVENHLIPQYGKLLSAPILYHKWSKNQGGAKLYASPLSDLSNKEVSLQTMDTISFQFFAHGIINIHCRPNA